MNKIIEQNIKKKTLKKKKLKKKVKVKKPIVKKQIIKYINKQYNPIARTVQENTGGIVYVKNLPEQPKTINKEDYVMTSLISKNKNNGENENITDLVIRKSEPQPDPKNVKDPEIFLQTERKKNNKRDKTANDIGRVELMNILKANGQKFNKKADKEILQNLVKNNFQNPQLIDLNSFSPEAFRNILVEQNKKSKKS